MAPRRVLVIDDDKAIHAVFKALLAKEGILVLSAMDAMQGPMMARQNTPDLIVLDILMPAGGGYSVFDRLKQMTPTMQIPILIYTAADVDKVRERIPDSPDVAVLAKPAAPEAIVEAVRRFVP